MAPQKKAKEKVENIVRRKKKKCKNLHIPFFLQKLAQFFSHFFWTKKNLDKFIPKNLQIAKNFQKFLTFFFQKNLRLLYAPFHGTLQTINQMAMPHCSSTYWCSLTRSVSQIKSFTFFKFGNLEHWLYWLITLLITAKYQISTLCFNFSLSISCVVL